MATQKKGITVTGVDVESFHRLKFARARMLPGEGLVRITGRNGSGKTSLLRAIRAALGGAAQVLPEAVHEGAEGGRVRLELSNGFTIGRRFTAAQPKGYLTVIGPDGGEHRQGKLDEWLGALSFDPLALFDLTGPRQREILLSVGGDPGLPARLDGIRAQRAQKYEARTPWISQKRQASGVPRPEGERPRPVDISAELARMGELQRLERDRQDAERAIVRQRDRAAAAAAEVAEIDRDIANLEAQIERLRSQRGVARDVEVGAVDRGIEMEVAFRALTDPAEELEQVKGRISQADEVNAALEPWKAFDRAGAAIAEAAEKVGQLTTEIEALDEQEKALLATAGIPVPGLGFAPDGSPTLNGRPLAVASGAERIRLAVAVALAANPQLRICLVDEANDIDLEGLAELDRLAREHGFQVWCARLGLEGNGEIVVVDGHAHGRDDADDETGDDGAAAADAEAMARTQG